MIPSTSYNFLAPSKTNIHFQSSGTTSGPLIVFLHGLGGSTESFEPLLPHFPHTYHLVCVDIEGFGKTPLNETTPLSFPKYVSDLHHLISHLQEHFPGAKDTSSSAASRGSSGTILIGHSLGGIITLHYAAKYPSDISGLLVLGVGGSMKGVPAAQQRMRDVAQTAREKGMGVVAEIAAKINFPMDRSTEDSQRDVVRKAVAGTNAEAYARTAENVGSDDHENPEYGNIKCPSVFVAGDGDMISPAKRSVDTSKVVGGPTEVYIVKSGHQMILQDLGGVEEAVDKMFDMIDAHKM